MSLVSFPRSSARVMADDGNDLQFCTTCAFSHACLSQGMDKSALMDLHVLVEHVGPYHAGDVLFREGDPFEAIAAVRAGTVKTCVTDRDGHEHVLGFHFPGEVIGLNAIDGHRYPCDAIALDTVMLCRFSFPKISVLAARVPGLQRELFRLLSRDIGRAALLAGDWTADQRVAAFLVGMSRRLAARGLFGGGVGGIHRAVQRGMRLDQRRRHGQRVVEVGQGGIGELGAGVEHGLRGGFDGGAKLLPLLVIPLKASRF